MTMVHYRIVPHDGGWAYKLGDVFSEPFPSRERAFKAAQAVAREQRTPGETAQIEYQDENGEWHVETAYGDDRPEADVKG